MFPERCAGWRSLRSSDNGCILMPKLVQKRELLHSRC